jgi:P-type E1-E2 ATPase
LPKDKAALIEELQREGRTVCFVGDGINDSIALKQANTSISLRGASTAATDTAQVILMDQTLEKLVMTFEIAQDLESSMNLGIALTVAPGVVGLGGAFFLGFGMVAPIMLNNFGLLLGLLNAWSPQRYAAEPAIGASGQLLEGDDE